MSKDEPPDVTAPRDARLETWARVIHGTYCKVGCEPDEGDIDEAPQFIRLADSEQALLVARVAELETEVEREADGHVRAMVRADAAEATLAKVAALADEWEQVELIMGPTNPSELILSTKSHTLHRSAEQLRAALASAGRPSDCGNDCDGPSGHAEGCPVHCQCYDETTPAASAGRPATSDGEDANGEHEVTVTEWPEARGMTYGWRCTCGANTDSDFGRWALADHALFAAWRDHINRPASPVVAPSATGEEARRLPRPDGIGRSGNDRSLMRHRLDLREGE